MPQDPRRPASESVEGFGPIFQNQGSRLFFEPAKLPGSYAYVGYVAQAMWKNAISTGCSKTFGTVGSLNDCYLN
jgi:hypothetical protein